MLAGASASPSIAQSVTSPAVLPDTLPATLPDTMPVAKLVAQPSDGHVEVGVTYHRLTADLGTLRQLFIRGALRTDEKNVWQGEVVGQRQFGDQGSFYGLSNTHVFTPNVYVITAAGASSGGFFLPRFRAGLTVGRKWLPHSLVTTAGVGYLEWKDAHRDAQLLLGVLYYFRVPLVLESGVTWNRSMPGSVISRYQYLAATQGRDRERLIIARIETGNEAYQLISEGAPIADFRSSGVSLGIRQWVRRRWGLAGKMEWYANPSYRRHGVTIGGFIQLE